MSAFARHFWLWLALPRLLLLMLFWGLNQLTQLPVWLAAGVIATDALILLWQLRQYHRSAEEHIRDTGAMALSWGGYLACLFAVFAAVTLWWDTLLIATRLPDPESFEASMRRQRALLYQLEPDASGEILRFEGEITFGLIARLRQELAMHDALRVIELTSPGGNVYEARGAAQLIAASELDTTVVGDCSSACTLLFMGGRSRRLSAGARLGFHGYGLAAEMHLPGYDIAAAEEKDRAFFLTRGASPAFTARMFQTPARSMWFPDPQTLRDAGVLTPVSAPDAAPEPPQRH